MNSYDTLTHTQAKTTAVTATQQTENPLTADVKVGHTHLRPEEQAVHNSLHHAAMWLLE